MANTPKFSVAFDAGSVENVRKVIDLHMLINFPFVIQLVADKPTCFGFLNSDNNIKPEELTFLLKTIWGDLHLNYYAHVTRCDILHADNQTPYVGDIPDGEQVNRAVAKEDIVRILFERPENEPDLIKYYAFKLNPMELDKGVKYWFNFDKKFALNSNMYWNFEDPLPDNIPVWVLTEEDTCDPTQIPSVLRVISEPDTRNGSPRLLDFDPETQEEYLSGNNWEIIAWRRMTVHGGTFDKYYAEHNVTEMSNWTMTLDAEESSPD